MLAEAASTIAGRQQWLAEAASAESCFRSHAFSKFEI
jgi:hypothetical protein